VFFSEELQYASRCGRISSCPIANAVVAIEESVGNELRLVTRTMLGERHLHRCVKTLWKYPQGRDQLHIQVRLRMPGKETLERNGEVSSAGN